MTGTGAEGTELGGILRLTWVTDHLVHVLDHSQSDEPSGTWTGLACPDHGLEIGADVDNATLQRLAQGDLADFVWEAPADFTTEHGQLILAAIRAHQKANKKQARDYGSRPWLCGPAPGQRTTKHSASCKPQA